MLDIWTVYDHPSDYPQHFVVRRWELAHPKEHYLFAALEQAREFLSAKALVRLGRFEQDDSAIIETWL